MPVRIRRLALISAVVVGAVVAGTVAFPSGRSSGFSSITPQIAFVRQHTQGQPASSKDECASLGSTGEYAAGQTCDIFGVSSGGGSPTPFTDNTPVMRTPSTMAGTGATTLVIPAPAGLVQYDLLLAQVTFVSGSGPFTPPAGWSTVDSQTAGGMDTVVYRQVAGPAEPASYTFTQVATTAMQGTILAFSNIDNNSPVDVSGGQSNAASTSDPTPTPTTNDQNDLLVMFFSHPGSQALTTPPSTTMASQGDGVTINDFLTATTTQAAPGATSVFTAGNPQGDASASQIVALRVANFNDWPTVSPDGSMLAFMGPKHKNLAAGTSSSDQSEEGELWVVNFDGTGRRKVADTVTGPSIVWSPDGTKIAYHANAGNSPDEPTRSITQVFVVDLTLPLSGTNPLQLTTDTFDNAFPQWSHAGDRIAFMKGSSCPQFDNRHPRFNAMTTASSASATSLAVGVPAHSAQDVMIAQITTEGDSVTPAAPAGWTPIRSDTSGATSADAISSLYFHVVTSAAEPATYTWSQIANTTPIQGTILDYVNAEVTNPVIASSGTSGTTNTLTAPSIPSGQPGLTVLALFAHNGTDLINTPAGMTNRANGSPGTGDNFEVADLVLAASGATGDKMTTPGSATSNWTGQQLLLDSRDHCGSVWVMNANGTGQTLVSGGPNVPFDNSLALTNLEVGDHLTSWSLDDAHLVFLADKGHTPETGAIFLTLSNGSANPTEITPGGPVVEFAQPIFSPDGTKIAFRGNEPGASGDGDIADLWVANFDGSSPVMVTHGASIWFHWSHNSRFIAFRGPKDVVSGSTIDDGNADVDVFDTTMPISGTNPALVTHAGSGNFSWSPDDTMLAIEGQPGSAPAAGVNNHASDTARAQIQLFTVNPCCTGPTLLTDGVQNDYRPVFLNGVPGGGGGGGAPPPTTTTTTAPVCAKTEPRLGGPDRIGTAILTSQDEFAAGAAQAVVLSRDDLFPDALDGTPLAVAKHGPLLLTPTSNLDPRTEAEIKRVLPAGGTVYVLGQTSALSQNVVNQLTADGFTVVRIGGPTRFETATMIADQGLGNPSKLFIATGLDFADALTGGAAAPTAHAAVVLSNGSTPNASTNSYIASHSSDTLYALGGPAAAAYPAATPIVGVDRDETATKVATTFFTKPTAVGVARDDAFPDALSGGAHIGEKAGPMLLAQTNALPSSTASYLQANKATICTAYVYGGPMAISDSTKNAIGTALS